MPGYRLANPDRVKIDVKGFCSHCNLLLREAMQTSCGHFYCQSCVRSLIQDQLSQIIVCLVDQKPLQKNEVFPDNFMRREVFALVVSCTFMEDGCSWKGEVRNLEAHTNGCEFLKVPCVHPDCGILVKKADLPEHLENKCLYRLVECPLCHANIVFVRMMHHNNSCELVQCVYTDCNAVVKKADLPWHLEDNHPLNSTDRQIPVDCEALEGLCPFSSIGCSKTEILNRGEMKEHLKQESIKHDILVLHFVLNHYFRMHNNSRATWTFPELSREHSERITNLENKTGDHEARLVDCNRTIEETTIDVASLKRQVEEINRKAELNARNGVRRMQSVEHELTLRNVTLADLEEYVREQEFSSYDGQLLWKITEFSRRKNEAVSGQKVSFYSPCFFTSRYGYKMCARIYLNGDGAGIGTHISVFFGVLPSQYDASLRWPFSQKVTFMLLDQDFVSHITASFIPDPNSHSFQGYPMFCSLEELNSHAYVRNDVMFLKVIVDTTGL